MSFQVGMMAPDISTDIMSKEFCQWVTFQGEVRLDLSLYATALSSKVVLSSVSRHRAGVRATVPAVTVQVRGKCSYGTCRSSQQARLGPLPSLSSSSAVVLRKGGDLAQV